MPKDQAAGEFIITPAPVYDAQRQRHQVDRAQRRGHHRAVYDDGRPGHRRRSRRRTPPTDPERKTTLHLRQGRQPADHDRAEGQPDPAGPGDYVTTYTYDEIYQLTAVTDAAGHTTHLRATTTSATSPRWSTRARTRPPTPTDYTTKYTLRPEPPGHERHRRARQVHRRHRVRPGRLVVAHHRPGRQHARSIDLDARGKPIEVKVPHDDRRHASPTAPPLRVRPGRQPDQGDHARGASRPPTTGRLRHDDRLRRAEPGQGAADRRTTRTTPATTPPDKTIYELRRRSAT